MALGKVRKILVYGLVGGIILALYGVVATLQTSNFARVYATYGGFFIVMSILWAMKFDDYMPDKYHVIGASVALIGVGIIYYAPR
jgi:small multidrug resistance family-3 protein